MLPRRILDGEIEAPDLLCGGTPCQAFSVAGKRQSLDDARGNLSLVFCQIADAIHSARTQLGKPSPIVFWENVPGVLHTKDNAFGCFLAELVGADAPLSSSSVRWPCAGLVAGPKRKAAWRVLDAQHFGVPQRRRRVFVVASSTAEGGGISPDKVLFERQGMLGNPSPSNVPRETTAAFAQSSFGAYSKASCTAATLRSSGGDMGGGSESLIVGTLTARDAEKQFANNQAVDSGMLIVCKKSTT